MPETPVKPTIRRATAADAEAMASLNAHVQALHAEALPWRFKPPGPAAFPPAAAAVLIAKPDNIIFVAEVAAATVGYVYAEVLRRAETPFAYAHETVYIHHISVAPDFRERDIGEALLDAVRAEAATLKIELITLDVWSFNASARSFFRRNGFRIYNERLWNKPE